MTQLSDERGRKALVRVRECVFGSVGFFEHASKGVQVAQRVTAFAPRIGGNHVDQRLNEARSVDVDEKLRKHADIGNGLRLSDNRRDCRDDTGAWIRSVATLPRENGKR